MSDDGGELLLDVYVTDATPEELRLFMRGRQWSRKTLECAVDTALVYARAGCLCVLLANGATRDMIRPAEFAFYRKQWACGGDDRRRDVLGVCRALRRLKFSID